MGCFGGKVVGLLIKFMNASNREIAFLLGLPFNVMTMDETVADAAQIIESRTPSYFITANVDFVAQARRNERLREILFHADRAVCDGMPLVWLSRLFRPALPERVAGADLVFRLFELAHAKKWRVYFLGSDPQTLCDAAEILKTRYPEMLQVGQFSPPFTAVEAWPNAAIVDSIQAAKPDLLLVAVGCPKQEYWIAEHYKKLGVPLSVGIGASLDFVSGTQVRAPLWMQKNGMEWFWRMLSHPKRLLKRYVVDFYYLVRLGLLQWRLTRGSRRQVNEALRTNGSKSSIDSGAMSINVIKWSGAVEQASLEDVQMPKDYDRPLLMDLSEVSFMDSSGIGRMAKCARSARQSGMPFGILQPSAIIRHLIKAMRLDTQFPIFETKAAATLYFEAELSQKAATRTKL